MKHLFVSYNLALELKNKGFDEECIGDYNPYGELITKYIGKNSDFKSPKECSAPFYQQVIDWFREKHNINIITPTQLMYSNEWICRAIQLQSKQELKIGGGCKDYYEALNKAIEEVLKLIK